VKHDANEARRYRIEGKGFDLDFMTDLRVEDSKAIIVRTLKYDGNEHRKWSATLTKIEGPLIILDAKFEEEIRHPLLGTVATGTRSIEYYWLDRWYNIFRFVQPTGELRNFYCNINVPPVLQGGVLSYVDLDLDVLVAPDLSFTVLDEDEFEANAARFNYPAEVRTRAQDALKQLIALIKERRFPFHGFK
jgi:protein associated with RNAse G/E